MLLLEQALESDTFTVVTLLSWAPLDRWVKNAKLTAVEMGMTMAVQVTETLQEHHGTHFSVERPSRADFSKPIWIVYKSAEMKRT